MAQNTIDKAKEAAIARVEAAKATSVLTPYIVAIGGMMHGLDGIKAEAAVLRDNAKASGGKVYDKVREAIVAGCESDVHPAALAQAFNDGLLLQGVTPHTSRPYSGTLKAAVTAYREGRISLETVQTKDMEGLRNACKTDEAKRVAELRKKLADYARELTVDELSEVVEMAGMWAEPRIAAKTAKKGAPAAPAATVEEITEAA